MSFKQGDGDGTVISAPPWVVENDLSAFIQFDGTVVPVPPWVVQDEDEEADENEQEVIAASLGSVPLPPSSPPRNYGEREAEMENSVCVSPSSTSTQDTRRKTRSMTLYETRQETNERIEEVVKIIEQKRKTTKKMKTTTSNRDLSSGVNESTSNTDDPLVLPPTGEQQLNPGLENLHICKDCGLRFCLKKSLLKHIHREHAASLKEKKYECNNCKMKFRYLSHLERHTRIHQGNIGKLIKCPECGAGFNSANSLPYHRRQVHNHNNNHDHLSEDSNTSVVTYPHIYIIHGNPNRYRCRNCRSRFRSKDTIPFHQFCKKKRKLKRFTCETCGKSFEFRKSLIYHMTIHENDKVGGRILCEICKMHFTSRKALKSHSKCHTGSNITKCSQCDAGFNNNRILFHHLCLHKGSGDCQSFKCRKCGEESANESYFCAHLLSHTATGQGSSTPAPNPQNDARSDNSVDVSTSTKQKSGLHDLANPVPVRSGKKFYVCDVCNAQFPTSSKLRRHEKCHSKISGGGRRFKCDMCAVKFNSRRALSYHILRHKAEGAGQFQCQICATSFTLKSNRDQHIRLKHQPKVLLDRLDPADMEYPVLSGNRTVINQMEDATTTAPTPNHLDSPRLPSPPQDFETNDGSVTFQNLPSSSKPVEPHPMEASEWNRPLPASNPARKEDRVHVASIPEMQPQQLMPAVKKPEPQRLQHATNSTVFVVALPMPVIYLPTDEVFLLDQNFEWKSLADSDRRSQAVKMQKTAVFGSKTTD